MRIQKNLLVALLMTVVMTLLLGVVYPLVVTGLAQAMFHDKANGQLREGDGRVIGSEIIAQAFAEPRYFHPRASAAGAGYDATNSGGTNFGPTNKKLIDAVKTAVGASRKENPNAEIPIDMVTASASGFDPDITPDNAMFQVPRVAKARRMPETDVRELVRKHIENRQLGFLGEPRVNVLMLNLALDKARGPSPTP
jgi:K+-transporting ATPase ATPase C chain